MYKHKRLLKLTDIHVDERGEIRAKLIDPAIKKNAFGHERCSGLLELVLRTIKEEGYLVQGVRRGPCHVVILSGHGDIGPIGCMGDPDDGDMLHALKEDPGVLLQITDVSACPVCKEEG